MAPRTESAPVPLSRTLLHAVAVGLVLGAAFGLLDGLIAWRTSRVALDALAVGGCLAAGTLEYALAWCVALIAAALVLRPLFVRRSLGVQTRTLAHLGAFLGLFLELYWWTRPYLFAGQRATSLPRLLVTLGIAIVALALAWCAARVLLALFARHALPLLVSALVLVAGGAASLGFAGASIGARGAPNARNARAPNVLLVVVDALRQDVLGCYGSSRVKTPHIDRLAAEGVVFENAFVQAPFTSTSFASFLTGKHARRHGLWMMVPGMRMLPTSTLPYHLKHGCSEDAAAGCFQPDDWLTASFHTGAISTTTGLVRGFDLYFEEMVGHGIVIADSPWSVFRSDLLLHLVVDKTRSRLGHDVTGTAKSWLAEVGDRRFMAMVHLYSTHTPYDPEERFRSLYADPAYTGPIRAFYAKERAAIDAGAFVPTAADVAQIQNLYYGGVSQADDRIGQLTEALRQRGILDETLVIVMSDHGESLGERHPADGRALWEHCHMTQTNLRIPLVMRWPTRLVAGTRVAARVDEIDLLPTLSDLLGLKLPQAHDEYGRIDGTSLVPLIEKRAQSVREYNIAENGALELCAQDGRYKLVVPRELLAPGEWPKGRTSDGRVPWLVDLVGDPHETQNALAEHPAEVERLLAVLREFDASMPKPLFDEVDDPRERARLESLGYTGHGLGGVK